MAYQPNYVITYSYHSTARSIWTWYSIVKWAIQLNCGAGVALGGGAIMAALSLHYMNLQEPQCSLLKKTEYSHFYRALNLHQVHIVKIKCIRYLKHKRKSVTV